VRRRCRWLALLVASLPVASAGAHSLDANLLTVQLQGDVARLEATPTFDALHGVDDDGDGRLTTAELEHHRAELRARYERGLILSSETGEVAKVVFFDVVVPGGAAETPEAGGHIRFRAQHQFTSAPRGLVVDYALFPADPEAAVGATAGYRAPGGDKVERLERVPLSRRRPRAVFFFTDELQPIGERLLMQAAAGQGRSDRQLGLREGLALLMLGLALLIFGLVLARRGGPPRRQRAP
jgi:hypothetical protein